MPAFDELLNSDFLRSYSYPALIDFSKATGLYRASGGTEEERATSALMRSRINFMGTDGMRGKVIPDSSKECITAFLQDIAFTPTLVEAASFSFAAMLLDRGILAQGDTVVVGNDGRDAAFDWHLHRAVCEGFNRADLNVLDIGIVPTAMVPYTALRKGYRCGAMLTASHNPANQNGIKFFLDGKKLLPEGECGDYALTSYMYYYCRCAKLPAKRGGALHDGRAEDNGVQLVLSALPKNAGALLGDIVLVFDNANGASAAISRKVLDRLGMIWSSRNEEPSGSNINRSCGVAEIEGIDQFEGSAGDAHGPFVTEMFDKGRSNPDGRVFGISLDGDGDRGFVLFYDKSKNSVHVIDGDKCGYILAEYFIAAKALDPKRYWFVTTIESDLMTATSAEKDLGLCSKVVSVGDKWIGHFSSGTLLVGLEVSGHLIFPVRFTDDFGTSASLFSGIGLLTGLLTLVAIRDLRLDAEKIIRPFEPGFSRTFYCFFVDKSKFCRNSSVWMSDRSIAEAKACELKKRNRLAMDMRLVVEDKEDLNVLYVSLVNDLGLQGCVFVRNSGTEDKIATYVKGRPDLKDALAEIGRGVQANHVRLMKNPARLEYGYEMFIMRSLSNRRELDCGDLRTALERETGAAVRETDLLSVVHGLKKEGRLAVRQDGSTTRIISVAEGM
jgi:phosphoglucosamine mutase